VVDFGCYLQVRDALFSSFSPRCFKENTFSFIKNIFSKTSAAVLWLLDFFNAQLFQNMFQLLSASSLAWESCVN